ncbi:MAG: hypothetical protein ACFNKE_06580, partial [Neisseria elongata]
RYSLRRLLLLSLLGVRRLSPKIDPSQQPSISKYSRILVFPILRNLTIVRGLEMSPKVAAYVAEMSRLSGVPLQTGRAV